MGEAIQVRELCTVDPRSGVRDPRRRIRDPRSGIRDPGSGIRDPGSGTRDLESAIWGPGSGVRSRRPRSRTPGGGEEGRFRGRHPTSCQAAKLGLWVVLAVCAYPCCRGIPDSGGRHLSQGSGRVQARRLGQPPVQVRPGLAEVLAGLACGPAQAHWSG